MKIALSAAVLCAVTVCGAAFAAEEAATDPAPEEQLTQVNAAISQIEDWLNSAANNRSSLETELRDTTQQITATSAAIAENQAAIGALETELELLAQRSTELEAARDAQQDLVKRAVRASYMSGSESYLKLLLNQEDPSLSARMLRYYSDFNTERLSRIQAFRATLEELEITATSIAEASQTLLTRQSELDTQVATLNDSRATRQSLLKELDSDIAARSGELAQLTEDRARVEELIKQINDAIASIPPPEQLTPFSEARGRLPWPVNGRALNRFGESYSDGNLHRQGIVLAADAGSPVRAVHPGRVVFSDWLRGSGLLVVVDHGDGYLSLYANNQTLVKNTGDWVNRGEALATAGENGGMDQPGLYFEIRRHGEALDPAVWCES
ncbi:MAG: peptidoglycan DD-metalloendopeptidase family protein [Pseudomonadota bacterium]